VAHYLDTSALVKLVVSEPETAALRAWLNDADRTPVASNLARTELLRAVRRA
jgi:predicted nucleic acid-binding protein